jgi:hypothetical protein
MSATATPAASPPLVGSSVARNAAGTTPFSRMLAKATSLTSIASFAAVGIILVGVLALVGGRYDRNVVHSQLAPQKIFFPPKGSPALLPGITQYAGQQLLTGDQAKAYADKFIKVHLTKVAGGKTYAQVSTAALAAPKDPTLAGQKAVLFQGETLRGLLLNAWGWSLVGTIATLAGLLLILFGAVLLILPLLNWRINLRGHGGVTGLDGV